MRLRSLSTAALAAALLLTGCPKKSDAPTAPLLQVSAATLAFDAVAGQGSPAAATVQVSNAGGGTLALPTASITYADGSGWLAAAVTGAAAPYTLTVTPDVAGLAPGTYHASVRVAAAGADGSPRDLAVTLSVQPPPALALSTAALAFSGVQDGAPPPAQHLTVSNAGGGALAAPTIQVEAGSAVPAWLTVTPTSATAPYTFDVSVDLAGLLPATYAATITVTSAGAADSPQVVEVTLAVDQATLLWISPPGITFSVAQGDPAPAARTVSLFNVGSGTLARPVATIQPIACGAGWLTATVTGSADPYTLLVAADPAGIPVGGCTAVINLDSGVGTGGTQGVLVSLWVADPAAADHLVQLSFSGMSWAERGFQGRATEIPQAVTLLQGGAGGALTEVSATLSAPGSDAWTATIPRGPYAIKVTPASGTPRYYEVASGAERVELGSEFAGVEAGRASSLVTPVTFDLGGLLPWSDATDRIQVFDQDAQAWWSSQFGGTVAVAGGATAGSFTFDWTPSNFALAAGADHVWVTQLRADPAGADPGYRVVAARDLGGIAMVDGTPITVDATGLTPTTASATVPLNLRAGAFAAAMPEAGTSPRLDVSVWAQGVPLHVDSAAMDLLQLSADPGADHDYGPVSYRRFLPRQYRETLFTSRSVRITRTHPGGKTRTLSAVSQRRDPIGAVPVAIGPAVGAVTGVRAGGVDVSTTPATGVGTSPTLTWDAPAVGAADGYQLFLVELYDDPARASAQIRSAGFATVTSRTFTPPAGWLQAGKTYLVRIEAVRDPTLADGLTPNLTSPQRGGTATWTQPISP